MSPVDPDGGHRIHCRLDELLEERGMTLTELAAQVIVTVVNLSVLKNDRARAIRFSTLTAICEALDCDVGDVIVVKSDSTAVDDVTVGMVCDFSRRVGRPRGTGPAAA